MAYDEDLARRVGEIIGKKKTFSSKKMFGGIGFLLHGNMCIAVWKEYLIVRVGEKDFDKMLKKKHVKVFDITGKPMRGWILVDKDGARTAASLNQWVDRSIRFVKTLPARG